ncbi:hypothetical protein PG987_003429 [Apiospora arundinis]
MAGRRLLHPHPKQQQAGGAGEHVLLSRIPSRRTSAPARPKKVGQGRCGHARTHTSARTNAPSTAVQCAAALAGRREICP